MPLVGLDFGERHPRAAGIERMHDRARFRGRKQPVAGERDDAKTRARVAERFRQRAVMIGGEIEVVHRPRQIEVAVGVEALDERRALMAQIALHLEVGIEREGRHVAVLQPAAELAVQRRIGEIGDMRGHARDAKPAMRARAFGEIAAAAPVGIGHHRLTADLVEGDVLRRMPRAARDRQRGEHALRIGRRPLQHLHAAHRAADDAEQRLDAEPVDQHRLRAHHVAEW